MDLLVIGSAGLVSTLLAHGLVDEFRLTLLGSGKRVWAGDGVLRRLRLLDNQVTVTTTGAILATYTVAPN